MKRLAGPSQILLGLSKADLEGVAVASGLQKFRGQQIYQSLLNGALTVQQLKPVRHVRLVLYHIAHPLSRYDDY